MDVGQIMDVWYMKDGRWVGVDRWIRRGDWSIILADKVWEEEPQS